MFREGEVSVHRACCERTTQPYSLGGGNPTPLDGEVRFIHATDQQMLQHVVREW